ncbi:glycosyltransferase [Pseudomarimonas arenosa]|uniref:Glycosyltransferase n=1 Tax=Pseudomarimonas arenosa TaxID=2774145 RepID=A0AAW3ZRV7_9GAMM|nr:glycosyltransferase [Pseudomarimonas arenosa]MBD8527605.1 glycosyltransferase [Pseudomarimonas arenosa]
MRVLMLSDVYFPRVNGVSTSIRTFCQWLLAQGCELCLIAPDYGADSGQQQVDASAGFPIVRVPARVIPFDPEDRLMRRRALRRAGEDVAAQGWDLIHCHTPFRAHQLALQLRKQHGLRVVETYHTYFEQYIAHYLPWAPAAWLRRFARWASRRLCSDVDHLIVPSEQMSEVLLGYGIATPHTVIPTGIDLSEFGRGDGRAFRRSRGVPDDRPALVTVSRLAREKNIDFLLEVLAKVRAQHPELLFLIAGEGPDAGRLRELSQQLGLAANVHFFGNLDRRSSLLDAYRAGDIFVFASPTETQGLVLIEAMAQGLPIVSTAVMGTATVLRDCPAALIAEQDVGDFAAKIDTLLTQPELRAQLAAVSPAAARLWSSDELMRRVWLLYCSLLPESRAAGTTAALSAESR